MEIGHARRMPEPTAAEIGCTFSRFSFAAFKAEEIRSVRLPEISQHPFL
jgi:hypothetical protein